MLFPHQQGRITVLVGYQHRIIKVCSTVSSVTLKNPTEEERGRLGRHETKQAAMGTEAIGSPSLTPVWVNSRILKTHTILVHCYQTKVLCSQHDPLYSDHSSCVCM